MKRDKELNKIIKTKKFVYSLSILLVVIGLIGLVVSEDKKAAPQTALPPDSAPTPVPTQPPVLPEPQKPEMPANANNEEQITDSEVISDEDSGEPWAPEDECEERIVDDEEEEPELPADFLDPKQDPELRQMILDLKLTARGVEILDEIDQLIWEWEEEIESSATFNCNDSSNALYAYDPYESYPDFDQLFVLVPEPHKSTIGHEFLHATLARLSESEERDLAIKLEEFYQANKQALDEYTLISSYEYIRDPVYDIYNLEFLPMYNRHTEMYAIFGTEVFDLPSDLEEHYSQYFQNRKETFDLKPGKRA